jgi:hypothetical protein
MDCTYRELCGRTRRHYTQRPSLWRNRFRRAALIAAQSAEVVERMAAGELAAHEIQETLTRLLDDVRRVDSGRVREQIENYRFSPVASQRAAARLFSDLLDSDSALDHITELTDSRNYQGLLDLFAAYDTCDLDDWLDAARTRGAVYLTGSDA